jgi:hypothetical protein
MFFHAPYWIPEFGFWISTMEVLIAEVTEEIVLSSLDAKERR